MNVGNAVYRRSRLFLSWLLSYLFILLLPLTISTYAFSESIHIIKDEISKAHTASLDQSKQFVDERLQEVQRIGIEMSGDKKLHSIMNSGTSLKSIHQYTLYEIQQYTKKYKLTNRFIDEMYLYFNNSNFVLSEQGMYNAYDFDWVNYNIPGVDFEGWLDTIQTKQNSLFLPLVKTTKDRHKVECIAFIQIKETIYWIENCLPR